MKPRKYVCPKCRQKSGVVILYGMPAPEAVEMAERGEVILGGCCIDLDQAERKCLDCGHEWKIGRPRQTGGTWRIA
jgi:hypothetical protein